MSRSRKYIPDIFFLMTRFWKKINDYLMPKWNKIHENVKVNLQVHLPGETLESFIYALPELTEASDFPKKKNQTRGRDRTTV